MSVAVIVLLHRHPEYASLSKLLLRRVAASRVQNFGEPQLAAFRSSKPRQNYVSNCQLCGICVTSMKSLNVHADVSLHLEKGGIPDSVEPPRVRAAAAGQRPPLGTTQLRASPKALVDEDVFMANFCLLSSDALDGGLRGTNAVIPGSRSASVAQRRRFWDCSKPSRGVGASRSQYSALRRSGPRTHRSLHCSRARQRSDY